MQDAHFFLLADLVLVTHVLFVVFVIAAVLLILIGARRGWQWIRNPWFRWTHAGAIGFVIAETWLGVVCPLTILENRLRAAAGHVRYDGGFVAHWLGELLYYDAAPWVFIAAYSAFGLLVLWCWVRYPPRTRRRASAEKS